MLAADLSNNPMGEAEMVSLYRVVDDDSNNLRLGIQQAKGSAIQMRLTLERICTFDENGILVPVEPKVTA
jgi:hypothetical protein